MISTKNFTHRVSAESTGDFPKNRFLPLLEAILNFCVKRRNAFISESERDRAISTTFLTHRICAESIDNISQNTFSCHF